MSPWRHREVSTRVCAVGGEVSNPQPIRALPRQTSCLMTHYGIPLTRIQRRTAALSSRARHTQIKKQKKHVNLNWNVSRTRYILAAWTHLLLASSSLVFLSFFYVMILLNCKWKGGMIASYRNRKSLVFLLFLDYFKERIPRKQELLKSQSKSYVFPIFLGLEIRNIHRESYTNIIVLKIS